MMTGPYIATSLLANLLGAVSQLDGKTQCYLLQKWLKEAAKLSGEYNSDDYYGPEGDSDD